MIRLAPLLLLALAACHSPETRKKIESMDNQAAPEAAERTAPAQPQ